MSLLTRYFTHPATVRVYTGQGRFGPEYQEPRAFSCLVDGKRRMVRNPQGEQVVSTYTLYLDPDDSISLGSLVTLNGLERPVLSSTTHELPWSGGVLTELNLG